ncbi:MAG TPA: ESX secretion-associated protein EspG [Actinophytocola sp.]|uniref:ESX secretion-associated protein EspG n=1 Tax=Actinophytocola sp. TaxID=1872138 RepID=UPI002DDD74DC|nr:ESX secretion-associated protein EspG [Actinophytocola sp.]HEV2781881.1 ESX secretion-associated protein EspG [Actinophytocola sp.]
MSTRTGFDASLDAVEIDLLCTYAGVPAPFPLRPRSVGATEVERRMHFGAARERLAARGLADERGPLGVAEILVHLLKSCPTALDLMLAIGARRLGALLLAHRGEALLAVCELDGPDHTAGLIALPPDDAVDELLLLLPELDAAKITPFTMPRGALVKVYRELLNRGRGGMGRYELDDLLGAHGIDERLADRMVTQLQPVLGNGQAGLARRAGYAGAWRRVGEELRWLDTERGRLRLGGNAEWTSVNPLFPNELYSAIRQLAASVGRNLDTG